MAAPASPAPPSPRHLLVVSHTFPPHRGIGGRRWAKFAKALARRGWQVHVLHSAIPPGLDDSLWSADVTGPGITAYALPQRYPTVLFKRPLTRLADKIAYRFWSRVMPLVAKGNWYDKAVRWERPLVAKARELIDRHGIRSVVVTGAPFRLMFHLLKLRDSHPHVRLVADFRDTWTWGPAYGHGTLGAERETYERHAEAAVARGYDRIISPAPTILEHLRNTHGVPEERTTTIPHAIDPDELGQAEPLRDDGTFRMVYAGSMYGAQEAEAYFDALTAGLLLTKKHHPGAFARVRMDLYITGHGTDIYRRKVQAAGLEATIRFHQPLPPARLFPILRQAHLVLIFIPSMNRDFMGTKFNEVFHLRRPVVHVGEPGKVSEHITENRLGISLPVARLSDALTRIISGEIQVEVGGDPGTDALLLDRVTERLENEVLA